MAGRTRISLLVCLFAFGLAGCGSNDGTIPPNQSSDLLALLDNVQSNAQTGDCTNAQAYAQEFSNRVDTLPSDVDSDVRNELTKAAAHLDQLASEPDACTPVEAGATGSSGVETTPDTTTTEETTPTTTEETSTTTTTDEEAPTEPDNNDSGNGQQPDQAPPPPPTNQGPGGDTGDTGGASPPSGGVTPGGGAG